MKKKILALLLTVVVGSQFILPVYAEDIEAYELNEAAEEIDNINIEDVIESFPEDTILSEDDAVPGVVDDDISEVYDEADETINVDDGSIVGDTGEEEADEDARNVIEVSNNELPKVGKLIKCPEGAVVYTCEDVANLIRDHVMARKSNSVTSETIKLFDNNIIAESMGSNKWRSYQPYYYSERDIFFKYATDIPWGYVTLSMTQTGDTVYPPGLGLGLCCISTITITYNANVEDFKSFYDDAQAAIKSVEGCSDLEKACRLAMWEAEHVYAEGSSGIDESVRCEDNIVKAYKKNENFTNGYKTYGTGKNATSGSKDLAQIYKYLCNNAGVTCKVCESHFPGYDTGVIAWNKVCIDNKWYNVDTFFLSLFASSYWHPDSPMYLYVGHIVNWTINTNDGSFCIKASSTDNYRYLLFSDSIPTTFFSGRYRTGNDTWHRQKMYYTYPETEDNTYTEADACTSKKYEDSILSQAGLYSFVGNVSQHLTGYLTFCDGKVYTSDESTGYIEYASFDDITNVHRISLNELPGFAGRVIGSINGRVYFTKKVSFSVAWYEDDDMCSLMKKYMDYDDEYWIYSMNPDGTDIKKVCGVYDSIDNPRYLYVQGNKVYLAKFNAYATQGAVYGTGEGKCNGLANEYDSDGAWVAKDLVFKRASEGLKLKIYYSPAHSDDAYKKGSYFKMKVGDVYNLMTCYE